MGNDTATFAELLRRFRTRVELTQEELAERADLSVDAVGLLERGERRRPHADTLARLAAALELSDAERAQVEAAARRPAPLAAQPPFAQLPAQPPLLGRAEALASVAALFEQHAARLVTLTGPGGVGKTRLALAAAERLASALADGAAFVSLAPVRDPARVIAEIAATLDVRERVGQTLQQRVIGALHQRHALLVLDNFEHQLAAAPLVSELLAACPRLAVLATSRAPLHLAAERQLAVPPLAVPAAGEGLSLEQLVEVPAVALFERRAREVAPDFGVTAANGDAILAICRRLDGLPLAIELAAAWVKLLPPQVLVERLDQRLPLLVGGPRDLPERQRTMHATIAWSYDLLDAGAQALLRSLAVWVGGFSLAAAEAMVAGLAEPGEGVLAALAALADASLLQRDLGAFASGEAWATPRYTMLETVREFALARLHAHAETADAHRQLARHLLTLAESASTAWDGPQSALWQDCVQREIDNFRLALHWAHDHDSETLVRLAAALWKFWYARGHLSEGRAWAEAAVLAASDRADLAAAKAKAGEGAGYLAFSQSDYAPARALLQASLNLYRLLEDEVGMAAALNALGLVAWHTGDYEAATDQLGQSLQWYRATEHTQGIAWALNNLGNIRYERGDYAAARQYFSESLALERTLGNSQGVASSLNNLGSVAYDQGDFAAAHALFDESLALKRALSNKTGIPVTLINIARVDYQQGAMQEAEACCLEALALWRDLGDARAVAVTLAQLARIACHAGAYAHARELLRESLATWRHVDHALYIIETLEAVATLLVATASEQLALQLFAATDALRTSIGAVIAPVERHYRDLPIAALRARFDEAAFAAAWSSGQALTREQALDFATQSLAA